MKPTLPVLLKDGYKVGHKFQYPANTTLIYSNLTPRSTRVAGDAGIIAVGMQYLNIEYLRDQFYDNFFRRSLDDVMRSYKRRINNYLGPDAITFDHIEALWKLGYLPLHVKSVPEGTFVPLRVPIMTLRNTHKDFFWVTNMLETLISCVVWPMSTSATTAFRYRKQFARFAKETGASPAFIDWQGHDFSFRGMMGPEAAAMSGAAHLMVFTGTDTIPAIDFIENYYGADSDKELIGGSVSATEHSVMCVDGQEDELATFKRLITEVVPKGIISVVSDTWDFWKVLTDYLPKLRDTILARDGKVVIRPDSGDPVRIICGDQTAPEGSPARLGAIRLLYNVFGGTVNCGGFIELDPHIGLIYGDSITPERQIAILEGLKKLGFASSNVVLGIGSYTYQYVTRDTYGFAMKATYAELAGDGDKLIRRDIFKKPATDDGMKNSAKGLLHVTSDKGKVVLHEGVSWADESLGLLQTTFLNGQISNITTLAEIRKRIQSYL